MAVSKRVGFNFFKTFTLREKKPVPINLKPLFEEVRLKYQKARENNEKEYKFVYEYYGEPARLSDVLLDVGTGFYHLIFERLDYVLPSRTTLHGDSTMIDLDDDEYIGHDVSLLYDPELHVFMLQRNRSSLGHTGIELCIRSMLHKYNVAKTFELSIIKDPTAQKRALNQSAYRRIQLKVSGEKAKGIVEKFWRKSPEGLDMVEIILSSGTRKSDEIENDFSKEVLEEFTNDDSEIKTLRIRSREEEGDPVEPIDLIDHKVEKFTTFTIEGHERQLNPLRVYDEMVMLYIDDERGMRNKIIRM